MKFCYFDESGTGSEPIAVVVGVIVDSLRMHVTKEHWGDLLDHLSGIVGRRLEELHTKDFYAGNGSFRGMEGDRRAAYITNTIEWFCERKHNFVHSAVRKDAFNEAKAAGGVAAKLASSWQAAAFHSVLSLQRAHQVLEKNKGHTVLIFDNKGAEEGPLADLIVSPPDWSDSYYSRAKKQQPLSHVVDAPYFADSKKVPMIQVADFFAYLLRRHAELAEGIARPRYEDEQARVSDWVTKLASRSIGSNHLYPANAKSRCATADCFYSHCPPSLRKLA